MGQPSPSIVRTWPDFDHHPPSLADVDKKVAALSNTGQTGPRNFVDHKLGPARRPDLAGIDRLRAESADISGLTRPTSDNPG